MLDLLPDGNFRQLPGYTPDIRKNVLDEALKFLEGCENDFFPVLETDSKTILLPQVEICLREMFFTKQVEFVLALGWVVRLVNMDTPDRASEDFKAGVSSVELEMEVIMRSLRATTMNFRVAGFVRGIMYVHLSWQASTDSVPAYCA
jgi:hypothetical protein